MNEEHSVSIFDDDTSAIQVKRSNVRRKAMILPFQKAQQMMTKLNGELNEESVDK